METKEIIEEKPLKYVLYARKSTESEEAQVLSIDSQIKEMLLIADKDNLNIVETKKESHSAKEANQRPVFNEIIEEIQQDKYDGILTWAPDRISRNAGDLGRIVDLMDQGKLKDIRTYGQRFTNSPNEKFLLMILGSQAKLENDNKVINVKRGLRARCEMGLWPCTAPTGYLNSKNVDNRCHVEVDPHRAPMIKKMFGKVAYENYSGRQLYQWLKDKDFKTKNNKHLTLSNVYILLRNTFYYGKFEYPKGSGQWFDGIHTPIITKELFDLVQNNISDHFVKNTGKDFAFTKMMKCGVCGSGITADEKFKKLKNGDVNRYVYYMCTKHTDSKCKNPIISETTLIEQLEKLIDKIDLNEIGMKNKIKEEVKRIKSFQSSLLNEKSEIKISNIDIRNYAKYILRNGKTEEKRELLGCLKSRVVVKDKKLIIREKN